MADDNRLLLGCGILRKEMSFLIEKNHWALDTDFLASGLHVDFAALQDALQNGFARNSGRNIIVFYGSCHPHMERMLEKADSFRTRGQNCVEMLLGRERFMQELSAGAFFLLEDWALHWDEAIGKTFGNKPEIAKEIFQLSCKYLLCLRTPCSEDFSREAEQIGSKTGLPLRWTDTGLTNLEAILRQAIETRKAGFRR